MKRPLVRGGNINTVLGIVLVLFGLAAIIWPVAAGVVSVLYIGVALFIAGFTELAQAYQIIGALNKIFWTFFGVVTALCGISLAAHPIIGISYIVALIAIYFLIDGVLKIIAVFMKGEHKIWYAFNGIISLILGYLVVSLLISQPLSADWVLGTFFGINLICKGFMVLAINSDNYIIN